MAQAASQAGVHYVPIAADFKGHLFCDGAATSWINGIVGYGDVESFHPNAQGQRAYARAVNRFLESTINLNYQHGFFESGMPKNPPPVP
jgi:lysophospholipase L1-like esterase